ncbi:hypothetical protein BJV74DRAFT_873960 [Russula compacta]|nr:hypothetical protein BJV74DRAFT_873960 [Russula compacta]
MRRHPGSTSSKVAFLKLIAPVRATAHIPLINTTERPRTSWMSSTAAVIAWSCRNSASDGSCSDILSCGASLGAACFM